MRYVKRTQARYWLLLVGNWKRTRTHKRFRAEKQGAFNFEAVRNSESLLPMIARSVSSKVGSFYTLLNVRGHLERCISTSQNDGPSHSNLKSIQEFSGEPLASTALSTRLAEDDCRN